VAKWCLLVGIPGLSRWTCRLPAKILVALGQVGETLLVPVTGLRRLPHHGASRRLSPLNMAPEDVPLPVLRGRLGSAASDGGRFMFGGVKPDSICAGRRPRDRRGR